MLDLYASLAGIKEDYQAPDNTQFCGWSKLRVPSGIPSQRFTISVRIRFGLSLRDQELFLSIPCESRCELTVLVNPCPELRLDSMDSLLPDRKADRSALSTKDLSSGSAPLD